MSRKQQGSEHWYDPASGGYILNESAVSDSAVMDALAQQHPEVASLVKWSVGTQMPTRQGSIFERDRYVTPQNIFTQFRLAYDAVQSDDVVAGAVETTEALAIGRIDLESDDDDETDIWNQIAEDIDLDSRIREMWREIFTVSQVYACLYWGKKSYKVGGKSDKGIKRKKKFDNLNVPIGIGILDPLKVVPIGNFLFNQERLAYIATKSEAVTFHDVLAGYNTTDLAVLQLIESAYEPSVDERSMLANLSINAENLFLLNQEYVWRITDTRPQYERFANVRMKSIFELLDLKQQLKQMDRAHLLGSTNFIMLVKKGTDQLPAKPSEISSLSAQVRTAARVPVIVGDHRLSVEIVTPKNDNTLRPERYNTVDSRLTARLFGLLNTGNYASGTKGDDSIKLARMASRGMEAKRDTIRRHVEKAVWKKSYELNESVFTAGGPPRLVFHPRHIALDLDPAWATLIQDLRDRGDISRESVLDEVDFDQDEESKKRQKEAEKYDKHFKPTNVPFSAAPGGGKVKAQPTPAEKKAAGRAGGGRTGGGGTNPDSKTPNASPVKPRKGNSS